MSSESAQKTDSLDKKVLSSVSKLRSRIDSVNDVVNQYLEKDLYTNASSEERVQYDLFLAYATTALFWAYLRTSGIDPRQHPITHEVERMKEYMSKAKTVHDRHLRPKVNVPAAKRFVKSSLWTAPENDTSQTNASRKRKRFDEEES